VLLRLEAAVVFDAAATIHIGLAPTKKKRGRCLQRTLSKGPPNFLPARTLGVAERSARFGLWTQPPDRTGHRGAHHRSLCPRYPRTLLCLHTRDATAPSRQASAVLLHAFSLSNLHRTGYALFLVWSLTTRKGINLMGLVIAIAALAPRPR